MWDSIYIWRDWRLKISHTGSQPWSANKNFGHQVLGELPWLAILTPHMSSHVIAGKVYDSTGKEQLHVWNFSEISSHGCFHLYLLTVINHIHEYDSYR